MLVIDPQNLGERRRWHLRDVTFPFPQPEVAVRSGRPSRKQNAALPAGIGSAGLHKAHLVPGNELNLSMHVPALAFLLHAADLRVCLC